jgi:hypothetical protein
MRDVLADTQVRNTRKGGGLTCKVTCMTKQSGGKQGNHSTFSFPELLLLCSFLSFPWGSTVCSCKNQGSR